jgi:hypothetical protein
MVSDGVADGSQDRSRRRRADISDQSLVTFSMSTSYKLRDLFAFSEIV